MERNRNIDVIRALAILLIVVFHVWALSYVPVFRGNLNIFIEYGGDLGVTVFLMLSGFAIYKSLSRRKDNFSYLPFVKDRLKRILPQYYISLIIFLFYTGNCFLLFSNNCNLFSHAFLFHGFYPGIEGGISGVAWTLTPIFLFYLISPLLFKAIEKKPKLTLVLSIIFTCLFKFIVYNLFAMSVNKIEWHYYFSYGKSIFGVLDQFVIGMFLAKYIGLPKDNKKMVLAISLIVISLVASYGWLTVDKNSVPLLTQNTGRYSNCFEGYIWHSVLTIIIALGIYGFSLIKINFENPISKAILCISKHEYGIYIWHLEFIRIVLQINPFAISLVNSQRRSLYVYLVIGSLFIGILMSVVIDGVDWKKVYDEFKQYIKVCIYIIGAIVSIISLKILGTTIIGFTRGGAYDEYVFMILYAIAVENLIMYLINRKSKNNKKLICVSAISIGLTIIWKVLFQDNSIYSFGLNLKYIVQMFQSMTIRFYDSIPHIAMLALLLLGIIFKLDIANEKTKKFTIYNCIAMNITLLLIVLKYLVFMGEEAMAASLFIEFYSGILFMQIVTVLVLYSPKILKNKIDIYFNE